ncbi:MAG: flagellar hook-basal body complex protein [Desulfarculus sp.]|nr:flagellar hook-basal body complex protein [Desulfarculus sp.]
MGMLSAMYSGVAGLNAHGRALSSVADNVANLSTHAFKASRSNFGDIMVHSLSSGGAVSNQVGTGSRVLNVQSMMTQGSLETTDVSTDLAINGKGFFGVRRVSTVTGTGATNTSQTTSTGNVGGLYYTRAGQFLLDKEGYMVNPNGLRLQGYNVDSEGNLTQLPTDLRIITQQSDAIPTTALDLSVNLDAEDTKTFAHTTGLNPSDLDTWNYTTSSRVYDSLGVAHNLSLYFQKLTDAPTVTPTGTATVWRVSMYENDDGTLTPVPTAKPDNTFYLCFDTDGHLLGTTDYFNGAAATRDIYQSRASVADPTAGTGTVVSNRIGENLSFTGQGSQQTYETAWSMSMNTGGVWPATMQIVIGGTTYTSGAVASANAAAQALAAAINADTGANTNFFAVVDTTGANPTLKIFADGGSTYTVSPVASANWLTGGTDAQWTMGDAINTINGASQASQGIFIPGVGNAGSVTINGTTVTWTAASTLANIRDAINANAILAPLVTARVDGTQIVITADNNGSQYNYTITGTGTGTVVPTTHMRGGLADSTATGVQATTALNTDGSSSLVLQRTTTGASQTLTIATTDTLGASQGLNFALWNQTEFAANAEGSPTSETEGKRTFAFSFTGATPNQEIVISFKPDAASASTQSAGSSETFYLYQNGAPRGTLQSLNISRDGLITGQFSNGTLQTLGAVVLTNFFNAEALQREGENLWAATLAAGSPVVNRPGQAGVGQVESGALEQSNVDLAAEFVKMINYQRAFQANSKTISTTDEMLAELINLKR